MRTRHGWRVSGLSVATLIGLAACGGGGSGSAAALSGTSQSTVNFVVTDTPSTAVTVLSFQVQITGAVLQPGNVSLLARPVTVDLAQLVNDTGFLSSTVIDSATYSSLELTYANPQITLQNNTGGTLNLRGQSCAAGAVCTYEPALNNATLTISNGVFPLTLTASSTSGLNLDLSIPDLLQSDLSVTFANGSSANLSLLGSGPVRINDVLATVNSIDGGDVHVTTAFGDSLVLSESSTTQYNFPTSICANSGASCLASGQIVAVDASLGGSGSLTIDSLNYVAPNGSSVTKALVLSGASGSPSSAKFLLQRNFNAQSVAPGEIATVSFASSASYEIGTANYPAVSNGSFAGPQDLLPGQEVIVDVGSDVVAGTAPAFTASSVLLQSSQVIGDVASLDSADSYLTIDTLTGLFTASGLHIQALGVQAGTQTTLVGLSAVSAATPGTLLAVSGPLLNVPGGMPTLAATQLRSR